MRRLLSALVATVVAGLTVAALATPASAHNVLTDSSPKAGASLAKGPSKISFTFNAPVQRGDDTIVVLGPNGSHWEKSQVASVLGNSVSTNVAPLGPAGVYTVSYHVISSDGHAVSGSMHFTLTKAGTGTPVSATSTGTQSGGGIPVWVWILIAIVVLGAVVGVVLRSNTGAKGGGGR
jgi:methionine-rich copper-binding protein CopC